MNRTMTAPLKRFPWMRTEANADMTPSFRWIMLFLFFAGLLACLCPTANAAGWDTSIDFRTRLQSFANRDFNASLRDDQWSFDNRLYLKMHGNLGAGLSAWLQPQAVFISNHAPNGTSQRLTQADLLQAWLQYDVETQGYRFSVRFGRQQLVYGDQRLLGHLGWKDVARTFDGIKLMLHRDHLRLDVFAVHPADIGQMTPNPASPHGSALVTWEDRTLIGGYGTCFIGTKTGVDAYFINWRHNQRAAVGKGRNVQTFGVRTFGSWQGFDATFEAAFQRGTWQNGIAQNASAFAAKAGYSLEFWHTRVGIEYDFSPGDDKADPATHKNFVFPFHTNHMHYGEMDYFSWANMKDFRISLSTSPISGLTFTGSVHFLSLDKARGDWLNVVGTGTVFPGAPSYIQTRAGTEIDLKAIYKTPRVPGLALVAQYALFNPGAAVAERNGGRADTARFAYAFAHYVF